ncbi:MAG: hypothetical protein JWL96_1647 [Sphingomonas bacterium]|uniref:hypothetical protein n=1 Tax=Sphingomonas bacterium TaxID=1895847 RepID=UPI00262F9F67|nr:hypothetical protein [Sphingomonas bacterium]MDB5709577.1 hypothetical protein [Sphingomonas bacterium]
MSIKQAIQGKWCLLIEEEPYSTEGRTLLIFRDGLLLNGDGVIGPYSVHAETLTVELADRVRLAVNPGDPETDLPASTVPSGATRLPAIVTTSFDDGSDDLLEYATLIRQTD